MLLRNHLRQSSSEQGFTLLETLVAIVIIAIVSAAIAPPILLATATRVQNQRVEQATQLARGEVDRIRLLVEQGQYQPADLPPLSSATVETTAPPAALPANPITDPTTPRTAATASFLVDLSPPNKPDTDKFVVQTFRADEQTATINRSSGTVSIPVAFWMGVRVYSFRSFANGTRPTGREQASLGFTSGEKLQSPLAVLYTPIIRSDQRFSLCKYHKFLAPNPPPNSNADTCTE